MFGDSEARASEDFTCTEVAIVDPLEGTSGLGGESVPTMGGVIVGARGGGGGSVARGGIVGAGSESVLRGGIVEGRGGGGGSGVVRGGIFEVRGGGGGNMVLGAHGRGGRGGRRGVEEVAGVAEEVAGVAEVAAPDHGVGEGDIGGRPCTTHLAFNSLR